MNIHTPTQEKLIDPFGRHIHYLRLSVTDRCNLRCVYCMSEKMTFLPRNEILSLEELYEVGRAFAALGANKIRLTGGEPLVRTGITELTQQLGKLDGLKDFSLTTNGVLLAKYAEKLKASGIDRINVSLDTLDADQYAKMARVGKLAETLQGIQIARQSGIHIKLNCVVLRGENDKMIVPLTNYAVEHNFDITFIEEMPLGKISSHQRENTLVSSKQVREILGKHYTLHTDDYNSGGPARYYQIDNTQTHVGFISPHSNNFCASCNRVRVTVEGQLLLCLGNEHAVDLRAILRASDYTRKKLQQTIVNAIRIKPEKHEFDISKTKIVRFMNMTGG